MSTYDAIVLAGGAARRLGGADKPAVKVGGMSLLDRAVEAASGACRVVVVGPRRATIRPVVWTREHPPLGGPVAALAAGLAFTKEDFILVIAADMPYIDGSAVEALVGAVTADGAVALDRFGKRQLLFALYDRKILHDRIIGIGTDGRAMHDLTNGLQLTEVPVGRVAEDCDTWEDVMSAYRATRGEGIA